MHNASAMSALMIRERGSRLSAFLNSNYSLAIPPHHNQMPSIPLMSRRVAGIQLDCALVFLLGGLPIPAIQVQSESERGVGLAEAIVQCQSLGRGRLGFGKSILRRKDPVLPIARQCVGVGKPEYASA